MDEMNWQILSKRVAGPPPIEQPGPEPVTPNADHTYDLYNTTSHEALVYGERRYGINLNWTDPDSGDQIKFWRESGSLDAVRYGEPIAITVRNGGFLAYRKRDYGINLDWSPTPVFEWILRSNSDHSDGDIVHAGVLLGLFNLVEADFLFYEPRPYGINLKWLRDKGKPPLKVHKYSVGR